MSSNGFNPMRWDCEKQGCFNKKRRPKIEQFAECLPGKIAFSDVDGIAEVNGRALVLEWKAQPTDIPTGQRIMWQRLTKTGILSVLCIAGDAETMDVTDTRYCHLGAWDKAWKTDNIQGVKDSIKRWVACARERR